MNLIVLKFNYLLITVVNISKHMYLMESLNMFKLNLDTIDKIRDWLQQFLVDGVYHLFSSLSWMNDKVDGWDDRQDLLFLSYEQKVSNSILLTGKLVELDFWFMGRSNVVLLWVISSLSAIFPFFVISQKQLYGHAYMQTKYVLDML